MGDGEERASDLLAVLVHRRLDVHTHRATRTAELALTQSIALFNNNKEINK
jgi:hypothetical protein